MWGGLPICRESRQVGNPPHHQAQHLPGGVTGGTPAGCASVLLLRRAVKGVRGGIEEAEKGHRRSDGGRRTVFRLLFLCSLGFSHRSLRPPAVPAYPRRFRAAVAAGWSASPP